jgi:hypothetical protein
MAICLKWLFGQNYDSVKMLFLVENTLVFGTGGNNEKWQLSFHAFVYKCLLK